MSKMMKKCKKCGSKIKYKIVCKEPFVGLKEVWYCTNNKCPKPKENK